MKHPSTRAIYRYWNERRGTNIAPARADIDPADIRHQLGDTFILAADFVDVLRFRLAGTRVCALFGRELKGENFAELWDDSSQKILERLTAAVCEDQTGAVVGLSGRGADGAEADLEMLLLPLSHSGHARIRALGVLAPVVPPYWLGERPVVELSVRTLRHIGGGVTELEAPIFMPPQQPDPPRLGSRIRHGFVVYSGGRETPSGDQTG
ncbi:MAG TPA: PAS domain-containing protein [Pseudolabrys sp.]|nr:PAS domain-containing protein [Pseudolabrys sp.]